ncbi:hypothetical protein DEO72_LG2g4330 [Vigna unguiculata]|uniref:Uncharacterized protein n=1 Tax=Vigna unguiculata TaxID=3917 RepID=A0A4D6L649_VIGUN|nr:hypothetical protein DEO72_LG2g4330 [Vigna unguiculata]
MFLYLPPSTRFLLLSNTVSSSRRRFTYINLFLQAINVSSHHSSEISSKTLSFGITFFYISSFVNA